MFAALPPSPRFADAPDRQGLVVTLALRAQAIALILVVIGLWGSNGGSGLEGGHAHAKTAAILPPG